MEKNWSRSLKKQTLDISGSSREAVNFIVISLTRLGIKLEYTTSKVCALDKHKNLRSLIMLVVYRRLWESAICGAHAARVRTLL